MCVSLPGASSHGGPVVSPSTRVPVAGDSSLGSQLQRYVRSVGDASRTGLVTMAWQSSRILRGRWLVGAAFIAACAGLAEFGIRADAASRWLSDEMDRLPSEPVGQAVAGLVVLWFVF